VVALATVATTLVAAGQADPATTPITTRPVDYLVTTAVGPGGPAPVEPATVPAPSATPASGGISASQVVSGAVASTSAVQVDASAQPDYQGSEPAYMTVSRAGSQVTVTVVPR
jgi:predicted component of type VI protein secretion system